MDPMQVDEELAPTIVAQATILALPPKAICTIAEFLASLSFANFSAFCNVSKTVKSCVSSRAYMFSPTCWSKLEKFILYTYDTYSRTMCLYIIVIIIFFDNDKM